MIRRDYYIVVTTSRCITTAGRFAFGGFDFRHRNPCP